MSGVETVAQPVGAAALTAMFRQAGRLAGDRSIGEVGIAPIGTGQMADTVRCTFADPPPGIPDSCVVKLPVGEGQTAVTARHAAVYDRELRFYRELRPELPALRCPEFYGTFDVDGEPAVALEDVRTGVQGDQISGATPLQARLAVDELAHFQARWWNDTDFGRQDWLQRRAGVPIPERQTRYLAAWEKVRDDVVDELVPGAAEVIEAYGDACDAWSQAYAGPMCLAHHDYRLDNMLYGPAGDDPAASGDDRIWIVDWQTLGWGPPAWDLAYFTGSSMTVTDRREAERGLVARHAARLRAAGIDWSDADAWEDYRRMAFSTFLLTMPAAGEVRSNDRARQMYLAMWNRAATMVTDLGATEFLEV